MRLLNRHKQIPGGFRFTQPQIPNYKFKTGQMFSDLVNEVIRLRKANPGLAKQHNLSTDKQTVESEVDEHNAQLCWNAGYTNFVTEGVLPKTWPLQQTFPSVGAAAGAGSSQPSTPPSWFKSLGRIKTGVRTLADWLGNEGKPVASELAESRASICATCVENKSGDLTSFFTKPASQLILRQLEERNQLKLSTAHDEKLGVCDACGCPLKLKVHCPVEVIRKHIPPGGQEQLVDYCWIRKEP